MSVENVEKFYEAIACNRELRSQLAELSRHHRKEEMDEAGITRLIEKQILPLAARMGLGFSLNDLWRHAEELQQTGLREDLEEEELDAVVGGGSNLCVLTNNSTSAGLCACYFIGAGSFTGPALEPGRAGKTGREKPGKQEGIHSCFLAGRLPP